MPFARYPIAKTCSTAAGLILLLAVVTVKGAYAQGNFVQVQEIRQKNLIDIRYKLLCTHGTAPESRGRGLILSLGEYALISTALHVLFPPEKEVSSLADDSCSYHLELRKARSEDAFAVLNLSEMLHSIAGAEEQRHTLDAYSLDQLKSLLPKHYGDLVGWLPNQIPYLAKDPIDRDIVFLLISKNKFRQSALQDNIRTIDTVCGEEDLGKMLAREHVVFLSGSASSLSKGNPVVNPFSAKTFDHESWIAGEEVCPGDSGSPVFFWVRDENCVEKLAFYGVVSFADPFDGEGQPRKCNKHFRVARPMALWNRLPYDPVLSGAHPNYAFLRCAHAAEIMKKTVKLALEQGKAAFADDAFKPTADFMRAIFEDAGHCECRDTSMGYNFVYTLISRNDSSIIERIGRILTRREPTARELITEFAAERIAGAVEAFDRGAHYEAAAHYEFLPSDLSAMVSDIGAEGAELTDIDADSVERLRAEYPELYREASERYSHDKELMQDRFEASGHEDGAALPPPPYDN